MLVVVGEATHAVLHSVGIAPCALWSFALFNLNLCDLSTADNLSEGRRRGI